MDFVDLDKVLDELEEEEKAAKDFIPGQEIKPSGYAEYVESHLDKPWETLSKAPIGKNIITTIVDHNHSSLNYDDPYGERLNKLDYITTNDVPPMKKLEQLGLDTSDYSFSTTDKHINDVIVSNIQLNSHGYVINDHINYTKEFSSLKHEDDSSLNSDISLKLKINSDVISESRSHLQASQVTSVQTDALSPNSEQELSSYTYPKSDIIVEGHEERKISMESFKETRNGYSVTCNSTKEHTKHFPSVNEEQNKVHVHQNIGKETIDEVNGLITQINDMEHLPNINHSDTESQQKPVGFVIEDTDISLNDMDDYLNEVPKCIGTDLQVSPQNMSIQLEQAPQSIESELQEASQSLCSELRQAVGNRLDLGIQLDQSPCRDAGNGPDVVADVPRSEVFSNMEGAVGHSPECDSLEQPVFKKDGEINSLEFNRKGVVSDINISLSQDGDCLEIEQIINEPISYTDYDCSCVSMNTTSTDSDFPTETLVVPQDVTGMVNNSVDSDYSSGQLMDSVNMRTHEQSGIGQGARPKEPSHMKRGRPNSLLGLSKVNLDTPFAGTHVVEDSALVIDQDSSQQNQWTGEIDKVTENVHEGVSNGHSERVGSESHVDDRLQDPNLSQSQIVNPTSSNEQQPPSALNDEASGSMSVLRRNFDSQGTAAADRRPHSWSPAGTVSPQLNKSKRPSSLNIPARGEFNPDDPVVVPSRTRGMLTPYPDEIQEESESTVTEESYDNTEDLEAVSEAVGAAATEDNPDLEIEPPSPSIIQTNLGKLAPDWLPDSQAIHCMQCKAKFTFTKRRHHCRACGKIFCSLCCSMKGRLTYMELKEARVCLSCHQILLAGSQRKPGEPKQVMFSDGIRPGGDLTELDGSAENSLPFRRTGRVQKKVEKPPGGQSSPKTRRLKNINNQRNLIPEDGLPPLCITVDGATECTFEDSSDPSTYMSKIKDDEAEAVIFAVNKNLFVSVKMLNLECCVKRSVWCFTSKGMCTVGQNEIIILLEEEQDELSPPRDIFEHFSNIYEESSKGNVINDLGYSIFHQSFLGSREHGGFLYISPTFQCLQKLLLPEPPYLFGILLQKWETPWAKVFPLRLLLRLGAEYRYYPCPLVSIRNRKPVFFEIGHTIMNLLADFRNYQYMLPQNKGVYIHMEDKKTVISFPRNRYEDLMKVVNNSNEHVMALGASFSTEADSHLVCIQSDEGNYQTQAINIQNKVRKVTGASFVVFNGALKASSGLTAKSSIVEDGLMVQITLESMNALKQAIKDMLDYTIGCGSITSSQPEEIVCIQWVEEDRLVNIGVKSPIDGMSMDMIENIRVHKATDYVGENRSIRWTEVFFIQNEDASSRWEPVDLSRLGEMLASAFCIAMTPHLDRLKEASLSKLGLRVTLDSERVGYEIGANNERLPDFYMNDLDNALIPVIHGAASQNQEGPIIMELIFHVLD